MTRALFSIATIFASLALPAGAAPGPCVTLDYQEMKEMEPVALQKEYCKARNGWTDNLGVAIDNVGQRRPSSPNASDLSTQCRAQYERIERVMAQRGISGNLSCGGM